MRTHESLHAWQRSRIFVLEVFRVTTKYWRPQNAEVIKQLQRSAISLRLNVAEGYALQTDGLFRKHLTIAYGSGVEALDALALLGDLTSDARADIDAVIREGKRCCSIVLGLKHSIERRQQQKGDAA
jgi:four helix bundle protein